MKDNIRSILAIFAAITVAIIAVVATSPHRSYDPSEPLPQCTTDTICLVFGGDFMQHLPQVEAARTAEGSYNYSSSIEYIAPMFHKADMAILNLETTLSTTGHYSGYPCFASPVEVADALVDMGIDIALLANNHCCDRMARGINTTIEQLNIRNIAHAGVFRDSIDHANNNIRRFEIRGIRFALVNYTYGTNGIATPKGKRVNRIDSTLIKQDLRSIPHDSVDCIVACMHWGNEYQRHQNAEQIGLANMLRREGVDIIIGCHPHVVQPFEVDSLGVTFYSLGNLVSNQQRRYCDGGIIAEVEVIRCDTVKGLRYNATAHPVWVLCPGYRILPRSVGDTLSMSESSRRLYERFMEDTDRLLGI